MQPITEDQEWTLRRWASTVGKRPRKRDKAFLKADKGLSEEQIDSWWKNIDSSNAVQGMESNKEPQLRNFNLNVDSVTPAVLQSIAADLSPNFQLQQPGAMTTNLALQDSHQQSFLGGLEFGPMDREFSLFLPTSSQETQNWSPIGMQQEDFPDSLPSMLDVPQQSNFWSPTMGTQRGFLRSAASSFNESSPLLSPPTSHRRCLTDVDRASYGSSLRTWDTSSTLVSVCDLYTDDFKNVDMEPGTDSSTNSSQLTRVPSLPTSRFSTANMPSEATSLIGIRGSFTRAHPTIHISLNSTLPAEPDPPSTSEKGQEKYKCTACQRGFNRKGDWKRHEEKHDPQTYWTCMLGDPAVPTRSGWTCEFCCCFKQTREEVVAHLMTKHKIYVCVNRKLESRTFTRKDKLKQHLQQVHDLHENSAAWEKWHQSARKKWAWGCGFCGGCLFTFQGTLSFHSVVHSSSHLYSYIAIPHYQTCSLTSIY